MNRKYSNAIAGFMALAAFLAGSFAAWTPQEAKADDILSSSVAAVCDVYEQGVAAVNSALNSLGQSLGINTSNVGQQAGAAAGSAAGSAIGGAIGIPGIGGGSVPVNVTGMDYQPAQDYFKNKQNLADPESKNAVDQKTQTDCISPVLQSLAKAAARRLVLNLTEATVNWINSGFNGNPAFISDPIDFLANSADQTVGDVIMNDPNLNFMCAPFRDQVRLALGNIYSNSTFFNKISCTATGILNNIASAGWDGWLTLSLQPQNTPTGAFLIAQNEIESRVSQRTTTVSTELNQGQGFLSYKQCEDDVYQVGSNGQPTGSPVFKSKPYNGDPAINNANSSNGSGKSQDAIDYVTKNGGPNNTLEIKTSCTVQTPGTTVASMLGFQANSEQRMDELGAALSNGVDSILNALANQLIDLATSTLANGILSPKNSAQTTYASSLDALPGQITSAAESAGSGGSSGGSSGGTGTSGSANSTNPFSYDSIFGTGFEEGVVNGAQNAAGSASSNNNNNPTPSSCLINVQQQYITGMNTLIDNENDYQVAVGSLTQTLTDAKTAFQAARTCNLLQNNTNATLRASLISANAIENIDGIIDSARSVPNIALNLSALGDLVANASTTITNLDAAEAAVSAAASLDDLTAAVAPLIGAPFDDPNTLGTTTSGLSTTSSATKTVTTYQQKTIISTSLSGEKGPNIINDVAAAAQSAGVSTLVFPGGVSFDPEVSLCLSGCGPQQIIPAGSSMSLNDFIKTVSQLIAPPYGFTNGQFTVSGLAGEVPVQGLACVTVTQNTSSSQNNNQNGFNGFENNNSGGTTGLNAPTDTLSGLKTFLTALQNVYTTPSCPINLNLGQ